VMRSLLVRPYLGYLLDHPAASPVRHLVRVARFRTGLLNPFPPWLSAKASRSIPVRHLFSGSLLPRASGVAGTQRLRAILVAFQMRNMVREERECARTGLRFCDVWSDVRLARFAVSTPQRLWNTTDESKRLVRRSLRGVIPEDIVSDMTKIYPQPVYDRAMRHDGAHVVREMLRTPQLSRAGFIRSEALRREYEKYVVSGREPQGLWAAMCVERWMRTSFQSTGTPAMRQKRASNGGKDDGGGQDAVVS
jgi:asparagine synthase (glutamine-hydrolysing)